MGWMLLFVAFVFFVDRFFLKIPDPSQYVRTISAISIRVIGI